MHKMILFVTSLFDLSPFDKGYNRRSIDEYFIASQKLLNLDINLLVFMDSSLKDKWDSRIRETKKANVQTVYLKISDLSLWGSIDRIRASRRPNLANEKLSSEYFLLIWSKFDLMQQAISSKSETYSHFVWIDFGISFWTQDVDLQRLQMLQTFDKFRVCTYWTSIYPLCVNKDYVFGTVWSQTPAGFWMTTKDIFEKMYPIFKDLTIELLNSGKVATEEDILSYIRCKYPELFDCFYGTYGSLIKSFCGIYVMNEWNLTQCLNNLKGSGRPTDLGEAHRLATITLKEILSGQFTVSNECFKLVTEIITSYTVNKSIN